MTHLRYGSIAIICFLFASCGDSTNNWGEAEITLWLAEHWGVDEIELEEQEGGTFVGIGTTRSGELIRFAVEKKTFHKEIHFKELDEKGSWVRATVFKKY